MKKNKLVTLATLAFACLAAPFAAFAADGNIVEIRAVDTAGMKFGARNLGDPNLCSANNPLIAGSKLYIRVRMLDSNYSDVVMSHGGTAPKPWGFKYTGIGSELLNTPKLGLYIGNHAVYADLSPTGPEAWQLSEVPLAYDEKGDPSTDWNYYTDLYFCYEIKAGDIGLPVKLMGKSGNIASSVDTEFCLFAVNTGIESYKLVNEDGDRAKFYFGPSFSDWDPEIEWPTGGTEPIRDYDLSGEGVYVKTVDFDRYNANGDAWTDGDIWRNVYQGSSKNPGMSPSIVIDGGNEITNVNTVWVWTTTDKVIPVGTGKIYDTEKGRYMLPVTIAPGATTVTFSLQGSPSASVGDEVTVYMGPTKDDVYTAIGNIVNVAVQRKVKIVEAPPASVEVKIDGEQTASMAPAVGTFDKKSATLQISLTQAYTADVTVRVHPTVKKNPGKQWETYVALSDYEESGIEYPETNVVFTAADMANGILTKNLFIYTLGSDDDTMAAPKGQGIEFSAEVADINGAKAFYSNNTKNVSARLYLTASNPIITVPENGKKLAETPQGERTYNFDIKIQDTYKNLLDDEGYQIIFKSGEQDSTNVVITCPDPSSSNGKWHFGLDGTLQENNGAFPVRYGGTGGSFTSEIQVIAPDGSKSTYAGATKASPTSVYVDVEPAATVEAKVSRKTWTEGTIVPVEFSVSKARSQTMYAFLRPIGASASLVSGDGIIIDEAASDGAEIAINDKDSTGTIYVKLLDGIREELGGTTVKFDVVLCTSSDYDPTMVVDGYSSKSLTLKVYNVEPTIKRVARAAGGQAVWNSEADEPIFPMAVAKGVMQKFTIDNLAEPGELDKASMNMKWQIEEYDAEGNYVHGDTKIFAGSAAANPLEYSFNYAGVAKIAVTVWDKDMDPDAVSTSYRFEVPVAGQPAISLFENLETFSELDLTGRLTINLSAAPADELAVRVTVTPYEVSGTPGKLLLDPMKRENQSVDNVYILRFTPGTSTAVQNILSFSDLDGTLASQSKGFKIALEVADDLMAKTINPDGILYKNYYICEEGRVYISNQAPTVVAPVSNEPTEEDDKGWSVSDGLDTSHSITFTVSNDCEDDKSAQFWVTFNNTNPANIDGTAVYGVLDGVNYTGGRTLVDADNPHTFSPMFGSNPGAAEISIKVEDKDYNAGTTPFERTWYYEVQAAKHLILSACGPGGGYTAGAAAYAYAKGLGFGHVYCSAGGTPSYQGNFSLDYNCGSKMTVTAYAFGYKVANPVDNGSLNAGYDVPMGPTGGNPGAAYYDYVSDPNYDSPGADGLDSFFYAWVGESTSSGAGGGGGGAGGGEAVLVIKPEQIEMAAKAQSITLPEDNASDGTSGAKTATTSYPDTIYDAVFSKEFRAADNRGDINQDGIPDVSVSQYGFGVLDGQAESTTAGAELVNLAKFNDDEDYLPAVPSAALVALGTKEAWEEVQIPFTAFYEIRGYHAGLNLRKVSDMDLSEAELLAFKRYLKKVGRYTDDVNTLKSIFKEAIWTPENPTDPTLDDTDADDLPDGYEYYYWYSAHVYGAKGERYGFWTGDVTRPTVIESEVIEAAFNPNSARDWASGEADLDGDGLTDLEEYLLGTNPVHWDSDGDGMPDGWEVLRGTDPLKADADANPDGDFMAWQVIKNQLVVELKNADGEVEIWGVDNSKGDYDIVRFDDATAPDGMILVSKDPLNGDAPVYFFDGDATALAEYADDKQVIKDMDVYAVYSTKELQADGKEVPRYWLGDKMVLRAGFLLVTTVVTLDDSTAVSDVKFVWSANDGSADNQVKIAKVVPGGKFEGDTWQAGEAELTAITNAVKLYRYGLKDNNIYAIDMPCELDKTTNRVYEVKGLKTILADIATPIIANENIVRITPAADMIYMHAQVFERNGFDPRTGWGRCDHGYCGKRWCPSCGGTETAGDAGLAVNTKAFTSYDEYYLMQYRYVNKLRDISKDIIKCNTTTTKITDIWKEATTAATVATALTSLTGESDMGGEVAGEPVNTSADTDGDGVADGWELYVLKNPNSAAVEDVGDDEWDELSAAIDANCEPTGLTGDGLNLAAEFLGTDVIAQYAGCPTIGGSEAAAQWNWLNKFFPTNPYASDTDGDGLTDIAEKASDFMTMDCHINDYGSSSVKTSFIYGNAENDETTICIRGGGLNPCSVDTDGDHLPDLWEYQFAGVVQDDSYIDFGMDGTDPYDAYTGARGADAVDPATGTYRNFDFDNDGLQNCDEYLTQVLRHLRYDVMTIGTTVADGDGFADAPDVTGMMNGMRLAGEADYIYGPSRSKDARPADHVTRRGFFGASPHSWDMNTTRTANKNGADRVMLTPGTTYSLVATNSFEKVPFMRYKDYVAATKYATTDPRMYDTDQDGMDDYYELFHGLNPLLGEGRDIIAEAYADVKFDKKSSNRPINCYNNEFTDPHWTEEVSYRDSLPMDFVRFPWLAGLGLADPDGDGLRNNQELIEVNGADPQPSATDPTPMWMTDSSFPYSYTAQYYKQSSGFASYWTGHSSWLYAFEMNEGYDTDNDGLTDGEEKTRTVLGASDPQISTDPARRQAMYFPGIQNGVPSLAISYSPSTISGIGADIFRQFTVECWIRPAPEALAANSKCTVLERVCKYPQSNFNSSDLTILTNLVVNANGPAGMGITTSDIVTNLAYAAGKQYVRSTFRIGIDNGKIYGLFDNSDARDSEAYIGVSSAKVQSDANITADKWYHVALTYDGREFAITVNGEGDADRYGRRTVTESTLIPANGVVDILQSIQYAFPYYMYLSLDSAFVLGSSADENGISLTEVPTAAAANYSRQYVGYIGEVRVWNGARTVEEIAANFDRRLSTEELLNNRSAVYDAKRAGATRSNNAGTAMLPAQLIQQYTFDGIHGATEPKYVATAPAAFTLNVTEPAATALSEINGVDIPVEVGWLAQMDDSIKPTVYTDYGYIPWIKNAVAHLPAFDGSVADSVYFGENLTGRSLPVEIGVSKFIFPRNGNPYTFVTAAKNYRSQRYQALAANSDSPTAFNSLRSLYSFDIGNQASATSDLVPLGGAFAKRCADFWDGQGAMDADVLTAYNGSTDEKANGLPDWWEEYCRDNYCFEDWDPSQVLTLDTYVDYNGARMTASEAYIRDLARGFLPSCTVDAAFVNVTDFDNDGLPDWWEDLYGINQKSADDRTRDDDNDGLNNMMEYILSEKFNLGYKFSPKDSRTGGPGAELDYFYKLGSLYVGEIFADHDMIEDWWEGQYNQNYVSTLVYDGKTDNDDDGWSAWSEARYSQQVSPLVADNLFHYDVTDGYVSDYPIPTIQLRVKYNGAREADIATASMAVKIGRTLDADKAYDAEYYVAGKTVATETSSGNRGTTTVSNGYKRVLGKWSNRHVLGTLTPGFIKAGSISIETTYDPSAIVYSWQVSYVNGGNNKSTFKRGSYEEYLTDSRLYGNNCSLLSTSDSYAKLNGLTVRSDLNSEVATLNWSNMNIGTVNLKTGEYDINLGAFDGQYGYTSTNHNSTVSMEDLTYRIVYNANESTGVPRDLYLGAADTGRIREGKNTIMVWADLDGNKTWNAGEPLGFARDVDISWRKREVELEIFDSSAISPRIDLVSGETDRGLSVTELYKDISNQVYQANTTQQGVDQALKRLSWMYANRIEPVTLPTGVNSGTRVRVVRWLIDGVPVGNCGIPQTTILDKRFWANGRSFLTEADFMTDGNFDLDWNSLSADVKRSTIQGVDSISEVAYLVVIGDDMTGWRSASDTNVAVKAMSTVITRKFDVAQAIPVTVSPGTVGSVVYTAKPTFKWALPNNSTSYTAFDLQVLDGSTVVWDSGTQLMPARDSNGYYVWEAPVYVGEDLAESKNYKWRVSALNAKFTTPKWSEAATFRMEPETVGSNVGKIRTQVKYFGPAETLANSVIRIEAYTSPDFSGIPAGRITVNAVDTEGDMLGLPMGNYYLRAYIDSEKYGVARVHDDWESWGYYSNRSGALKDIYSPIAAVIDEQTGDGMLFTIYIEDTDLNGNRLPDAWEMAVNNGELSDGTSDIDTTLDCGLAIKDTLAGTLASKQLLSAEFELPVAHLVSTLSTKGMVSLLTGIKPNAIGVNGAGDIEVLNEVEGVTIDSIAIENGMLVIKVSGELAPATEVPSSAIYSVVDAQGESRVVTAIVEGKATFAGEWTTAAVKSIKIGGEAETIDLGETGDAGFYRVIVK